LHTWLSQQHHGLRTFRIFQQKLDDLGNGDPGQRAMCRLLKGIVGSYFDEEPLPVAVADRTYRRLLDTVPSPDFDGKCRPGGWPISTVSPRWICVINPSSVG
jgi:hypothetical protein